MSTARWRHQTADVPLSTVAVFHAGISGVDVQLGTQVLWVESREHWEDISEQVLAEFAKLPPRRTIPARTDGVKPTDYLSVNCSGACYSTEEEVDE